MTDPLRSDAFGKTVTEKDPVPDHSVRKSRDDDLMISPKRVPRPVSSEDSSGRFQQIHAPPRKCAGARRMLATLRRDHFETMRFQQSAQTSPREHRDVTAPSQIRPARPGDPRRISISIAGQQQHGATFSQLLFQRLDKVVWINYVLDNVER